MIDIRQGDASDIAALMPVMSAAFDPAFGEAWTAPQCASALVMPGTILLVATSSEAMAGFALVRSVADEAELLLLAVDPEHQGKGIGRALVENILVVLRHKYVKSLFLEVRINNPADNFYKRLGFGKIGTRANYYRSISGQYTDAVTLAITIGDE